MWNVTFNANDDDRDCSEDEKFKHHEAAEEIRWNWKV